ncbi:dolichol-phosphate mannosyltransferase subunit 3 [Diaphorina citri]|uniref:Dolichol-phosphate mannosyltransferase subunit 3 n=1 Tax=Diaphorina citri TaxID=121845 RepID=A0A1S3DKV9_DIACI|nr:dolichol-phosphate mannosyltransferase subunit 3 [Diaphorina citri]KAI5730628.1 hypothetical protein M8J76_015787 [Diaphorina citri]KAI5735575.1 hypothetical protein M8J77_020168 [Diaphorina citri]
MTKLLEWLTGTTLFLAVWLSVVMNDLNLDIVKNNINIIVPLPLIIIALFGVYSIIVVLWRVYNFNDCKEAAQELQTEIKEAKEYLSKKGYKF